MEIERSRELGELRWRTRGETACRDVGMRGIGARVREEGVRRDELA